MDTFQGQIVHTSEWDENIDLKNKNVAVIGTGATSVQLVPSIAGKVKKLFVFQIGGMGSDRVYATNWRGKPLGQTIYTNSRSTAIGRPLLVFIRALPVRY